LIDDIKHVSTVEMTGFIAATHALDIEKMRSNRTTLITQGSPDWCRTASLKKFEQYSGIRIFAMLSNSHGFT
jgi:hypothetical protein